MDNSTTNHSQTNDAEIVLSVKDLTIATKKRDGQGQSLVHGISFDVHEGETLCIVGESGSGKSLTSFAIMGLLPPDALEVTGGSITLQNQSLLELSDEAIRHLRAQSMSMIFQEPMTALNPVQRIGDQIAEVLQLHKKSLSHSEQLVLTIQALKDVGMPDPDKIHLSYPHELSGGQRQRVMIAMALILGPKLLIADEPTTALDVTTQKQILALIKKLQKERGTSVIFVTHDFGVVADIADRILVMRKGDQVEIGKALDILSAPQHDYTRSLIACVPNVYPPVREKTKKDSVIIIESLFKRYGKKSFFGKSRQVNALNDINLDIYRDEITSVVGESGSGKSTLARCLMGLVEPSEGTVRLDGRPLAPLCRHRSAQQKKRMQIVFQDPYRSLNPRLTIGTSLSEGLTNLGISGPDAIKKITNVLEIVGLDASCLERFPHQFSGGQRQRLCLARAIVMEPEVLICDESVSALDVLVQEQVLALLLDIKKKTGVSIIFITHDLRVASQISDRIIVMQKGKVIEDDVPSKIIFEPNSAYTKELIESAPGRHWDFKHFQPAKVAIA